MSRARPFVDPETEETVWFDTDNSRATVEQLQLLADWEDIDIDDLLDEGLNQKQVLFRLRQRATPDIIPAHVLERRRQREAQKGKYPACRICTLEGDYCPGGVTRHHFVPRWLMLTLKNYQHYAPRTLCTIPICVQTHRDLHRRTDKWKSIVRYLRYPERRFAHKMLHELEVEHPVIFDLIASGDYHAYESQLIHDFMAGKFLEEKGSYNLPEYIKPL
jgi:hypothetical protein